MKTIQFEIDYSFCPEGHRWVYLSANLLYPDVFYCEKCNCFYEPTVRKVERGAINKDFSSDRERDLIARAKFLDWKNNLTFKDWESQNEKL